jgi:Tol biopolymer transport system component/TolA-binding protein
VWPKKCVLVSLILALSAVFFGCEEDTSITCIEWTPDGKTVLFAFDGKIYRYRVGSKEFARPLIEGGLVEDRFSVSPDGAFVYFTGDLKGSFDIWRLAIAGGALTRLTEALEKEFSPVIAPDGNTLFYVRQDGTGTDLWRLDLATMRGVRLTRNRDIEMFPAVSPDGTLVAYASAKPDGTKSLQLIDVGTKRTLPLLGEYDSILSIRFSPDGKYIGFIADGKIHAIRTSYRELSGLDYHTRLAGLTKAYREVGDGLAFTWHKDSHAVLFSDEAGDLLLRNFDWGSKSRFFVGQGRDDLPRYSPDGKYVALATGLREEGKEPVSPILLVVSRDKKEYHWGAGPLITIAAWCKEEGRLADALWALSLLEKETVNQQDLRELYSAKAEILIRLGRYQEAAEIYERHFPYEPLKLVELYLYYVGDLRKARKILTISQDEDVKKRAAMLLPLDDAQLKLFAEAERKLLNGDFNASIAAHRKFTAEFPRTKAAEFLSFEMGRIFFEHMQQPAKALETYRRALKDYPGSEYAMEAHASLVDIYRSQRKWRQALAEVEKVLELCDDSRRCARLVLEGTRILLFNLEDAERAEAFARRLTEYRPAEAGEVLAEVVSIFDQAERYDISNELLPFLIAAYEVDVREISGLVKSLDFMTDEDFVSARFEKIPGWFLERVDILIDGMPESREREDLQMVKTFFLQRTSAGLIEAWSTSEMASGDMEEDLHRNIRIGVYYAIANMAQNERNVERALSYYSKLALTTDSRELYGTYEECSILLSEADGEKKEQLISLLLDFLDNERERRVAFWGEAARFYGILSEAAGARRDEREEIELRRTRAERTKPFYRKLLSEEAVPSLADNAYYRLISAEDDEAWQLYVETRGGLPGVINPRTVEDYRTFLNLYPRSEFYGRALDELMDALERTGNFHLALDLIEGFRSQLAEARSESPEVKAHLAELLLRSGNLYSEKLLLKERGAGAYEELFKNYQHSAEWSEAARQLSLYYDETSRYEQEIEVLTSLVERRPQFKWVLKGEASLALARALEKDGQWPRAEKAYIDFFADFPDHPEAESGSLFLAIFDRLSDKSVRTIYSEHPAAVKGVISQMSPRGRERLYKIVPELRDALDAG